jgi:hypothetical protein
MITPILYTLILDRRHVPYVLIQMFLLTSQHKTVFYPLAIDWEVFFNWLGLDTE